MDKINCTVISHKYTCLMKIKEVVKSKQMTNFELCCAMLSLFSNPAPEPPRTFWKLCHDLRHDDRFSFRLFSPHPYHTTDRLNRHLWLHSAWSVRPVQTNSVWAMWIKIQFRRCETIQGNPGYHRGRKVFYIKYRCCR
jgi:hypothetical protein